MYKKLLTIITLAIAISSCKKNDDNSGGGGTTVFTTTEITQISSSTAVSGGSITNYNGTTITVKGIVWSLTPNPKVVSSSKTIDGSGVASFVSYLNGLSPNTTYYVKAYFINSSDTIYGNEITFKTTPQQVTATAFLNNYTAGSILGGYRLDSGIIAIPTADAMVSYNYLSVPNGTAWKDTLGAATNLVDFAGASYTRSFNLTMLGTNLTVSRYTQVNTSGWAVLGDDYGAATVTIPGTGSLNFPKQAVKATPVQKLVNFPVSYGDSISQTSATVLNATANATLPFIGSTTGPLTITQTTTVSSKNIAWGTMKIKGYTDSLSTIVQKYTTSIKTDIASSNTTISALIPSILSQYGVTNGQVITTTLYRYWVVGKGLVMTLNGDGSATVTTGL